MNTARKTSTLLSLRSPLVLLTAFVSVVVGANPVLGAETMASPPEAAASNGHSASGASPEKAAAASAAPTWTFQVDPLTFALGLAHVQVERRLGPDWSLYVGPNLRLFDGVLDETHQPYLGFGVEVGVRRFFTGQAPTGCWAEARGVVAYLTSTESTSSEAGPAQSIGGYGSLLVGYTGVLWNHLVLSGGLGFQYLAYHLGDYGFGGPFPAAHTAIGVAF